MLTSRFFITLEPCPHLNGKHTIFGRLVSGQAILEKIAKVDVDKNDRPLEPVLIARCGELEKRQKKKASPAMKRMADEESADRGRRRKSNDEDEEMVDTPEPTRPRRDRRQSDNVVDEGLRGRPRQRSGSRAKSRALSSSGEDDGSGSDSTTSPVKKHKRKRSPSPSRHLEDGHLDEERKYERRRRSLPNQYGDERYNRNYGEDDRYKPSPRRDNRDYAGRRRDDRYRPDRGRRQYDEDEGRLDGGGRLGGGDYDDYEAPVKFKGRGVMKYREPGRL